MKKLKSLPSMSKRTERNTSKHICRTCMIASPPLRPLFPHASQTRTFEKVLFLTTGLVIKSIDGLPQNICKKCSKIIERAIHFRKVSHDVENTFLHSNKFKKTWHKESRRDLSLGTRESICRTCMGSLELRPLFPYPSQNQKFERALFQVTGLQIKVNDGLPQRICTVCAQTIENTIKFRAQSHSAQKSFSKCHNKNNTKDLIRRESEAVNEISIKKEIAVKSEDIEPDVIDIQADLANEEIKHEERPDSPDRFSSEEDYFGDFTTFVDNEALLETKEYHRPYLDLIEGEGPIDPKKPVQCKICKKISKCLNAFASHSAIHLGYEILCEYCGQKCLNIGALLRHQRGKHGLARDQSFACSYCKFLALDKEMLESHERRLHTKERPFVCDECGEAFYTKRVLTQHSYTHKTDKPFQCNLCPSKFKLRNHLTTHTNLVHKKKFKYTYGCYMCAKRYKKPFETRKHLVRVHGIPKEQQGKVLRFNIEEHEKAIP